MALVEGISPIAGIGLAFLLAVALAELAKFRVKADKGFNWLALAGVLYMFAGATTVTTGGFVGELLTSSIVEGFQKLITSFAWLAAIIGAVFVAYQILLEKG